MPQNAYVCVLLAYHNGFKFIKEQINSILSQEDIKLHIFISIDGDSECEKSFINSLIRENKRITLLPKLTKPNGAGANFFHLIKNINVGDFTHFSFSDQDDIWKNKKLYTAVRSMEINKADAYSSNVTAFWGNGKKKALVKSINQRKYDHLMEAAGPGCTYVVSAKLFSILQNFIRSNKFVYQIKLHDWLIYAFAIRFGYKWYFDKNTDLTLYRQHNDNVIGVNMGIKAILKRINMLISGEWFCQSFKIYKLLYVNNEFSINNKKDFYKFILINSRDLRRNLFDCYIIKVIALYLYIKECLNKY